MTPEELAQVQAGDVLHERSLGGYCLAWTVASVRVTGSLRDSAKETVAIRFKSTLLAGMPSILFGDDPAAKNWHPAAGCLNVARRAS
jgi:hypothetical protein